MQGIFISYRRQDSQSAAGRLADHLKDQLGHVPIFRDVENIEPGVDFVDAIDRALRSCAILLAVIGPRWLTATTPAGTRRLDDPNDYTRLEIATALHRDGVRVIPILVEGAVMPDSEQLPDDLKPLARRNAIELDDKRWEYDVSQLVETLCKVLGVASARTPPGGAGPARGPAQAHARQEQSPPPIPPAVSGKWKKWLAWGLGGLVGLGILSSLLEDSSTPPPLVIPDSVAPAPVIVPENTPVPATANPLDVPPENTAATFNLTGLWQDNEGGQHQINQQGNRLVIQGLSPDGVVVGAGILQGRTGWVEYTLNGYALRAQVEVAADARQLSVVVADPSTGQREALTMWRMP